MPNDEEILPRKKQFIDKFLRLELKNDRPELNFDCPASIVFQRHKNRDEAKNKWLEKVD